jgi:hypothetical protein
VKVGDIVKLKPEAWRTDRTALVVSHVECIGNCVFRVLWHHSSAIEKVNGQYFEVVSEGR